MFRLRNRIFILVLVAILSIFLFGIEFVGDEVMTIVEEKYKPVQQIFLQELASLDAEVPVELITQSQRIFKKEIPKPQDHSYSKAVVMGKKSSDHVTWVASELKDWNTFVYEVDRQSGSLTVPMNKGNEVMVYLTYIIDHYDQLADITFFVHSSRYSWHNNDLFDNDISLMIKHLLPQRVIREGYVNLRCQWYPGCPTWLSTNTDIVDEEKPEEQLMAEVWSSLFPEDTMPATLAQPCCSQFALSRTRIQSIPRVEYERLRTWLMQTPLSDFHVGRIFEYVWQWLWIGKSTVCVGQHACYCDVYGACFDDEEDFQGWFEERYHVRKAEWEVVEREAALGDELVVQSLLHGQREKVVLRIEELKIDVDRKWMRMLDKRNQALNNGRDPKWRAKIAQRDVDMGDDLLS